MNPQTIAERLAHSLGGVWRVSPYPVPEQFDPEKWYGWVATGDTEGYTIMVNIPAPDSPFQGISAAIAPTGQRHREELGYTQLDEAIDDLARWIAILGHQRSEAN